MSDPRQQRDMARQLEQQRVIERPGAAGQTTFYAAGSWTPVIAGTTIAGTFTYVGQVGRYVRIGSQVMIHGYVQISAIGVAPTGNMIITGLPFTSANVLDYSLSIGFMDNINTSANIVQLTALVRINTAEIWLGEAFDNAAWARFPAANFTNASAGIEVSGVYQLP